MRFFLGMIALLAGISSLSAADSQAAVQATQESSNGLPNISARFHPESTSLDVFADLLVWCAKESGSENWAQVITASGAKTKCDVRDVRFDWDAGFRAGLGYGMKHDQWDTQLYYTWFRTRGSDHVSSTPGTVFSAYLGNFYVDNQNGAGISGIAYQKASMEWKIHFSMFDWELGRNFRVSRALSLRPFIGLKGGWIHQSIHTKWHNSNRSGAEFFKEGRENLKNNFWGIGPSAGLNTKWDLFVRQKHSFNLFGDLSGAIMWGHWTLGDVYKNNIEQEVVVKLSHINSAAVTLRTFLGFGWDATFNRDRSHFSAKLGYEMQFWLNQLQLYFFDTGRLDNVLTLQGGTLEFRFDF
ncbi:MAG: hypothetical protein HYX48_07650 [Chlamydiales bacterium]|nr:hypothetical protein [Chlamydiales bacterium]